MQQLSTDVVVVGGGPAGSTAATMLAKAGQTVIQLERLRHPRHQIGESLLPSTVHGVCRMLDVFDEMQKAGFVRKRGGTFRWGRAGEPWTVAFQSQTLADANYAFQVERARFDQILFENARAHGVDCREGVEALDLMTEDGRIAGVTARDKNGEQVAVNARFVIDASGHGSRLARHVGSKVYSESFRNVAVYGYYRGAGRRPAPYDGNIVVAAFAQGWCWFIPLTADLTSVGAVVDHTHAGRIGEDRAGALTQFVQECPIITDLLRDADRITEGMYGEVRVRKDWSYLTDKLVGSGILLAGDAACFVDPVLSSGVHLATYSGILAARTVATILAGEIDEGDCLQEFERRYLREFTVWYEFLLAFVDLQKDVDEYFWKAQCVLDATEQASEAFINLIAGAGTARKEFFDRRHGLGDEFARVINATADLGDGEPLPSEGTETGRMVALLRRRSREGNDLTQLTPSGVPMFGDGLVPTADGLRWTYPKPPVPAPEAI